MRVSPGRLIITAACCAGAAAAPASVAQATSTGAALSTGVRAAGAGASARSGAGTKAGSASPAPVRLAADPDHPTVGQQVRITVTAPPAGAPLAGAAGFTWDLAGRGAYSRHTGRVAQTELTFQTPGIHTVAVRFVAGGRIRLGVLTVTVGPRLAPRLAARVSHAGRAPHSSRTPRADSGGLSGRVTARAAGDPGVTIADFHFSPATTTIHAGDTITWSNNGPSSHTASATGGSFNTGVLKKGQSASHTFTQPGTFAYVCQIHPFMHGTIVVLAATTSTASGTTTHTTTTPTTTTPTTTTAAASTAPTLPNTGFNVLAGLCAGLVLLGLGASLRRTRAR